MTYNFITDTKHRSSKRVYGIKNLLSRYRNISRKKQTVSKFRDLYRITNSNINQNYQKLYKNNNKVFRRTSGLCSNFYVIGSKYGSLGNKPFRKYKWFNNYKIPNFDKYLKIKFISNVDGILSRNFVMLGVLHLV